MFGFVKKYLLINICYLIAIIGIVSFLFQFYNNPVSHSISDWGSFGEYISMLISIISIAFIFITYDEQKRTNHTMCFENTYWNLRNKIKIQDDDMKMKDISDKIKKHFEGEVKITLSDFILLLNYYWILYANNNDKIKIGFHIVELLVKYILTTDLIDSNKKKIYLGLLLNEHNDENKFCFLCYFANIIYSEMDQNLLSNKVLMDLYKDVGRSIKDLSFSCKTSAMLVEYVYKEDYGYYENEYRSESYAETLKRLKSNTI